MGLDELSPFKPEERIIEYLLANASDRVLVEKSLTDFADETASESPAPGGGSISAYVGALGAALGAMVANLSAHKKGWDARWATFSVWAQKGQACKQKLIGLVDADTSAFNGIMTAFGMPKGTPEEKAARTAAIQAATKRAIEVPLQVMETAYASLETIRAMAEEGNPNSISDAGVGALCARTAVLGAWLNVRINAAGYDDKAWVEQVLTKGKDLERKTLAAEAEILQIVEGKL